MNKMSEVPNKLRYKNGVYFYLTPIYNKTKRDNNEYEK